MEVPGFKAKTSSGEAISRSGLLGVSYILSFFNHVGSETCTKQTSSLKEGYEALTEKGYTIFGVSEDSEKKQNKFIHKDSLPYSLIPDEDHELAKIFDIYGEKKFMGRISDAVHRTTFVIGKDGRFEHVIHPVLSADHHNQILQLLK